MPEGERKFVHKFNWKISREETYEDRWNLVEQNWNACLWSYKFGMGKMDSRANSRGSDSDKARTVCFIQFRSHNSSTS
jgi:hypothetical protein